MCGIWCAFGVSVNSALDAEYCDCVKALEPRGPELTKTFRDDNIFLGFTRLAINGLTANGDQPIHVANKIAICNGELYNYKQIADRLIFKLPEGASDCYVLPHLLDKFSPKLAFRAIDGVFACVVVDNQKKRVWVARDPYGVRPLFEAVDAHGTRYWSSEIKALPKGCVKIDPFPPGTYRIFSTETFEMLEEFRYHTVPWVKSSGYASTGTLREALVNAVEKRLLSDRPVGALLSGGLDSSLVASIAAMKLAERGQKLHTFSIGLPGSTDLKYAREVAEHIKSEHHEILCSKQDFLNAVESVIYAIESYDITTVRASVGNWLVGKWIRENTDIKVVLNGDGSDEVGGGYLYFYKAPTEDEFEEESERLLEEIHLFDVLRSDRCISSHGLEPRTPFLDKQLVATWRGAPTYMRRPILGERVEKWMLRRAFEGTGLLPSSVLHRKKEAFSDGVSSAEDSWYLTVSKHAEEEGIVIGQWEHNPPSTPEGAWYRKTFERMFGSVAARFIPHFWMPRWVENVNDPSARVLKELYD
jgi:asparagine synthase (glutamine-hydrolysing)